MNETKRGRAQLRDMSAAQGVYEVDYVMHINTQRIKNIGAPEIIRRMVTANVLPVSRHILKNGRYKLEEDGKIIYLLEKTGASWSAIS